MPRNLYKKLLNEAGQFYKELGKIRCKAIDNSFVVFSNAGFTHLLIKERKSRPINEQIRKLFLLQHIPQIINSGHTKQEVRIISNKKYGQIEYFSLSEIVGNKIVRMILRKLGTGNYHFWSIMDE